ncbi:hypothetical protein [Streptomyces sp. NPDC051135]|uniref:hypothetical protein n=1 Tax=unclassified Streptomyces TaxID=2593676 RepID=UPI00341DF9CB
MRAGGELWQARLPDAAAYRLRALLDAVEDGQRVHDVPPWSRLLAGTAEGASLVPQLPQMRAVRRGADMLGSCVGFDQVGGRDTDAALQLAERGVVVAHALRPETTAVACRPRFRLP